MKILLINIGTIVSGDLRSPFVEGDSLLMEGGVIKAVGSISSGDAEGAELVVDVGGMTVVPGLIDSHVHVTFGDWTPRQKAIDYLESYVHGGITTVISASEVHVPGRPNDPVGIKALALAAQRCFQTYRPGGMKVHAGSVIVEPGLSEQDFADLAREGVWLAKVGFGSFKKPADAAGSVRSAQRHGFKVMCHTGGASILGSLPVTADDLLAMNPDIAGHVNGGPVAMADGDIERVIEGSIIALQIVQAGNIRTAMKTVEMAEKGGCFERVLIASDTPTGTGVMPLGVIKSIAEMTTLCGAEPGRIIAAATGNVARIYGLDSGLLAPGRAADIVVIDAPLGGSKPTALESLRNGDIPAVAAVFSAGVPRFIGTSRNTPPPTRTIRVTQEKR